jgi:predicted nicotinamide N-methyase
LCNESERKEVDVLGDNWDVVLGSDLVYNNVGVTLLPRVMRALAASGATVLYGHTRGRFELFDIQFLDNLRVEGLRVAEVEEGGVVVPIQSSVDGPEETLTELFPELRPVVFRIDLPSSPSDETTTGS